jgi:hypothetical protein
MPDRGCSRQDETNGSSAERQPDFVKFGTSTTKKVGKYSGERGKNGYILTIEKSKQEKKSVQK